MAESRGEFAGVLRELRTRARLTQEGLAEAAGLSHRTVSDLERGLATAPQKETVRLLGDALALIGPERERFETVARGRPLPGGSAAAAAAMRSLPRDVASFTGRQRELEQLAKSAMTAGGVVSIHAIGGMAGIGKTAFAVHAAHQLGKLLAGVLEPHADRITVRGPGGCRLTPAERHGTVALVTQEHQVFRGTLRDNLAIARLGAGSRRGSPTATGRSSAIGEMGQSRQGASALPNLRCTWRQGRGAVRG
jgi:transcriptional regulator with XRE-family HTH domain